jgi:hypothetical protein
MAKRFMECDIYRKDHTNPFRVLSVNWKDTPATSGHIVLVEKKAVVTLLEDIKAAIGDRLLAKGPLSKSYAHSVTDKINQFLEDTKV